MDLASAMELEEVRDWSDATLFQDNSDCLGGGHAAALAEQSRSGEVDLHRAWIEALLAEYYDPMYAYQRQSKAQRIEFSGPQGEVVEYLRQRASKRQA